LSNVANILLPSTDSAARSKGKVVRSYCYLSLYALRHGRSTVNRCRLPSVYVGLMAQRCRSIVAPTSSSPIVHLCCPIAKIPRQYSIQVYVGTRPGWPLRHAVLRT